MVIPLQRAMRVAVACGAIAIAIAVAVAPLAAHDLERTQVMLSVARDRSFVLEIRNDPAWLLMRMESFAGGTIPADVTPAARDARLRDLANIFIDRIVLFVPGREIRPASVEYVAPRVDDRAATPLATFRLTGVLPADAPTLRWLYGLVIDPYPLTIRHPDGHTTTDWINGSDWSRTIDLSARLPRPTRIDIARDYVRLGYTHILPKGLDHILFVLGLFLLNARLRPVLMQVTTFTVAHSITLALSVYDVISVPSRIVEPLIALSIAYVALENLATTRLKPWRLALVFAFGLLHGMGFAGVLADLGLPREEFVTALLSFNAGVEAGQVTVIALAAVTVAWSRDRDWYHRFIVTPASLAIATTGLYWTVTRVL